MGGSNNSTQMTNQQLAQMRQYLAPYQQALNLPALANIISSGGQGGGVLPMNTAVSMAGNEAATAGLNEQEAAQRSMGQRIGAAVMSGISQGPVAAFQDLNARNIAAAQNGTAMNQQQLQNSNFKSAYQTISGLINSLFGGYTNISDAGINNSNYNWLTGNNGLMGGLGSMWHSDRRLKSKIDVVGKVGPLRLYEYDIDGHRERGVMAQEARALFPEVIHEDAKGLMVNYKRLLELVKNAN
jgi:Chaperone of endosialidase